MEVEKLRIDSWRMPTVLGLLDLRDVSGRLAGRLGDLRIEIDTHRHRYPRQTVDWATAIAIEPGGVRLRGMAIEPAGEFGLLFDRAVGEALAKWEALEASRAACASGAMPALLVRLLQERHPLLSAAAVAVCREPLFAADGETIVGIRPPAPSKPLQRKRARFFRGMLEGVWTSRELPEDQRLRARREAYDRWMAETGLHGPRRVGRYWMMGDLFPHARDWDELQEMLAAYPLPSEDPAS